jgi:hypothetical protein
MEGRRVPTRHVISLAVAGGWRAWNVVAAIAGLHQAHSDRLAFIYLGASDKSEKQPKCIY